MNESSKTRFQTSGNEALESHWMGLNKVIISLLLYLKLSLQQNQEGRLGVPRAQQVSLRED